MVMVKIQLNWTEEKRPITATTTDLDIWLNGKMV